MERFAKADWLSLLNLRDIALFICCCKKVQKNPSQKCEEEERQPFMSHYKQQQSGIAFSLFTTIIISPVTTLFKLYLTFFNALFFILCPADVVWEMIYLYIT